MGDFLEAEWLSAPHPQLRRGAAYLTVSARFSSSLTLLGSPPDLLPSIAPARRAVARRYCPEVGEVTQRAYIPPPTCPLTTSVRPAATLRLPPFSRLRGWADRPRALGLPSDFVVTNVCTGVLQAGDADILWVCSAGIGHRLTRVRFSFFLWPLRG